MTRLSRVQEECWGSGAGERGCDLAGDMPGFTHASHYHATGASEDPLTRGGKGLINSANQGFYGAGLGFDYAGPKSQ
jgi:hypothetical protein